MAIKKFLSESGFKHFVEKVIGKTDISSVGDGTLKGAVSSLNIKLDGKQPASTAITTNNISDQSVKYATSAGSAKKFGGFTADLGTNNISDTWVPVISNGKFQHRIIPTIYNSTNPTFPGDTYFNGQLQVSRNVFDYFHLYFLTNNIPVFHTQCVDNNHQYTIGSKMGYGLVSEWGDLVFYALNTGIFAFHGSGIYTGTWSAASSKKYKQNIKDLKQEDTLKLLELRPVEFDYINSGIHSHGLIAEEVSEIMPDMVIYNNENEPESIDYPQFVSHLIKLCQIQQEQIDKLTKRVEDLEAKLDK